MDAGQFETLVFSAIAELPEKFRSAMENVAVVVETSARPAKLRETKISRGEVLLGLYEGIPNTVWGRSESGILPDKITIFQEPIEALARGDETAVKKLVDDVVRHEIGHHFGFSDSDLRELKRKKNQPGGGPNTR